MTESIHRGSRVIGQSIAGLLLFACAASGLELASALAGRPVGEIRFDVPVRVDEREFRRELPLRTGQALDEELLRQSLEWLRQKEIFSSVEVATEARGDRVDVTFRLIPTDIVVGVEVVGARSVSETDVLRRARLREDEPLFHSKAAAAQDRVRAFYAEHGYPHAQIDVETRTERPGRVRVRIRIREGRPVRIREIEISGLPTDQEERARRALPFAVNAVFTRDRVQQGREALLRYFRERSFYEVDVRAASEIDEDAARLRFALSTGPRFEIRIDGNRYLARERLLGLTDLAKRPIITDGTWRVLARRMEELYQLEGYRFADVSLEIAGEDPKRIGFEIDEGPRVSVTEVRFEGISRLSVKQLLAVMATGPGSWVPGAGKNVWLSDALLEEDLERIRARYRQAGHLEAEVSNVRLRFRGERQRVRVTLEISEGPRTIVDRVEVRGADDLPSIATYPLTQQTGRAHDPALLEEDQRGLEARMGALGYPDARVAAEVKSLDANGNDSRVSIVYRVVPGPRVRVGRILIQQNYFTRDRVIRRELGFRSGDPFDPAVLLDAQRRIYRLGLFRSVSVRGIQSEGAVRDIAVRVTERPGGEIQYGFGYNTRAGLRNFVQVGHRNVLGTGRPISLRSELNLAPRDLVPDEYLINLEEREPRLFEGPYDLRSNAVLQRSERSIDEFSIRRFSVSSGLEREFLPRLRGSLLVEFEDSRVFDVAPDVLLTGQDRGRLRLVTLNPILLYDGRDDAFAPTRGVFESLRIRYGSPSFGSDVHFFKVNVQHSQYVPLVAGWSWIYAARAGLAEALGSSSAIPLRERFFLGGRTTVRGFDENSIGPQGARGNPLGGDLVVGANSELRFPLLWGIAGAVFVDGGGVYLRRRGVSIGDFRESAGPGLRYQTPIGAISLDYGLKLDRRSGESIGEVHFTIGNIF